VIHTSKDAPGNSPTRRPAPTPTHTRRSCGGRNGGSRRWSIGTNYTRSSLAALDVPQHELSMVQLGFGDIRVDGFCRIRRCHTQSNVT
jgi:hypothetical protein